MIRVELVKIRRYDRCRTLNGIEQRICVLHLDADTRGNSFLCGIGDGPDMWANNYELFQCQWFDDVVCARSHKPAAHDRRIDHDYAAFSSRGLAASFALGQAVMDDGLDTGPIVDDVTVLLNPDDPLVNESRIEALISAWDRTRDVVDVVVLDTVDLPHDVIDLAQPKADPDSVYPVVFEALGYVWP